MLEGGLWIRNACLKKPGLFRIYTLRAQGSSYYKHSQSIHVHTGRTVIHVECRWINLQISHIVGSKVLYARWVLLSVYTFLKYTCDPKNRTHFNGWSVCLENFRVVTSSIPRTCFRTEFKQKSHVWCSSNVVYVCNTLYTWGSQCKECVCVRASEKCSKRVVIAGNWQWQNRDQCTDGCNRGDCKTIVWH
jgi:hypothetical protein